MTFRLLLSGSLLMAVLMSCEKEIELATSSNKCIVANALITENEPIEVFVYTDVDYVGRKSSRLLENANLAVYCNGELLEEICGMNTDSSYCTSVIPKIGETYTIKVDCQQYRTVTADATVPNPIQVKVLQCDSVQVILYSDGYRTHNSSGEVEISVADTTNELRYYLLTITGYYRPYNNPGAIKTTTLVPEYNSAAVQPISMTDILNHLFESSDVQHVEEREYILFSNRRWRGGSTVLRFGLEHSSDMPSDIDVMSFDEDYYKYFITKELQMTSNEESLMFSEPVTLHSNVKNGLGLFAGYNMATAKLNSVCDTIFKD